MAIKLKKYVVVIFLVLALIVHNSALSPSKDKLKKNPKKDKPAHGSNKADGSNHDGGWKYNCECDSAPDGSWSYHWGTGSGPDGSSFGFGSGSGRSPDGGGAGFGFGFGSSTGSGGGSSESYGGGTGYGFGSGDGVGSNSGNKATGNNMFIPGVQGTPKALDVENDSEKNS
ncbi:hypothetical protein P3X46_021334 [Hevea brasiliensis]|uniref:Glycine-rich protein n=1 Tax=Hevea brasiliensis TaxID=3981 RepID=A0ABQ9LIT7_HEVBR|nr:uncharacterized protein LOC110645815 [Hevea brasiliensis]KAJ9166611.1 hypothetical protein P3X46_021334 [Hevea brasiliensis]